MKTMLIRTFYLVILVTTITSCVSSRNSTIVSTNYDETKNETEYIVLPYGKVSLDGKWEKTHYNSVSKQQFFKNKDSVLLAIAFVKSNNYEFNLKGSHTGFEFVKAFYEWDSKYFVETHGLEREVIEENNTNNYMIYRIYENTDKEGFDTYFLIGERNGNASKFSISITEKLTPLEKVQFLKTIYLH